MVKYKLGSIVYYYRSQELMEEAIEDAQTRNRPLRLLFLAEIVIDTAKNEVLKCRHPQEDVFDAYLDGWNQTMNPVKSLKETNGLWSKLTKTWK